MDTKTVYFIVLLRDAVNSFLSTSESPKLSIIGLIEINTCDLKLPLSTSQEENNKIQFPRKSLTFVNNRY